MVVTLLGKCPDRLPLFLKSCCSDFRAQLSSPTAASPPLCTPSTPYPVRSSTNARAETIDTKSHDRESAQTNAKPFRSVLSPVIISHRAANICAATSDNTTDWLFLDVNPRAFLKRLFISSWEGGEFPRGARDGFVVVDTRVVAGSADKVLTGTKSGGLKTDNERAYLELLVIGLMGGN